MLKTNYFPSGVRLLPCVLCLLLACAEDTRANLPDGFSVDGGAPLDAFGDSPGDAFASMDVPVDAGADTIDESTCAGRSRFIYLLSFDQELMRYDPSEDDALTRLGRVRCPGADPNAHNMTVDRSGRVWLFDQAGSLFYVEPSDVSCTGTSFQVRQAEFEFRGATFVYDAAFTSTSTPEERLLVSGGPADIEGDPLTNWSNEIAAIDTDTLELRRLRRVDESASVLLASSGDGALWTAASIEGVTQLLPTDASTGETAAPSGEVPAEVGFQSSIVFWGGRFYVFLPQGGTNGSTNVHTYTPSTDTWEFVTNIDERIVGSGVSTCAPVVLI